MATVQSLLNTPHSQRTDVSITLSSPVPVLQFAIDPVPNTLSNTIESDDTESEYN